MRNLTTGLLFEHRVRRSFQWYAAFKRHISDSCEHLTYYTRLLAIVEFLLTSISKRRQNGSLNIAKDGTYVLGLEKFDFGELGKGSQANRR